MTTGTCLLPAASYASCVCTRRPLMTRPYQRLSPHTAAAAAAAAARRSQPPHGTQVAGVLAAQTNNGRGVAGLAWQVRGAGHRGAVYSSLPACSPAPALH